MKALVTLDQAKNHIMMTHDQDDEMIQLLIDAASSAILKYLDGFGDTFEDSNGDVDKSLVPFDIKAACLLLVGEYYKNREGEQDGAVDPSFGYGFLPRPVVALLYPYRQAVFS